MLNSILQKISQIARELVIKPFGYQVGKLPLCLAMVVPLAMANIPPAIAQMTNEIRKEKVNSVDLITQQDHFVTVSPFTDGIYRFGQSSQPGQYGVTYLIFEVFQSGITYGAFYEVASEYACFSGTVDNQHLNLAVEEMDGTIYPYAIALEERSTVATHGGLIRVVGLQGFHELEHLNGNGQNLLKSCERN